MKIIRIFLYILVSISLYSCESRKDYIFENLEKPSIGLSKSNSGNGESFITDSVKFNYGTYTVFYSANTLSVVKGTLTAEYDKTALEVVINENLKSVVVKPLKAGAFEINIIHKDVYNNFGSAKLYLTVFDNLLPVTVFEYTVKTDNKVEINLEKSFDRDHKFGGRITEYRFQPKTNYEFYSSSPKANVQFPSKGTFPVTFWVKDNNNVWSEPLSTFITI